MWVGSFIRAQQKHAATLEDMQRWGALLTRNSTIAHESGTLDTLGCMPRGGLLVPVFQALVTNTTLQALAPHRAPERPVEPAGGSRRRPGHAGSRLVLVSKAYPVFTCPSSVVEAPRTVVRYPQIVGSGLGQATAIFEIENKSWSRM